MPSHRIFLKGGASFSISASNIQFNDKGEIEIFDDNGQKNKDVFIQASEVAAIVPTELLLDEKNSTAF